MSAEKEKLEQKIGEALGLEMACSEGSSRARLKRIIG
jgi:hypothetical protein